LLNIWMLYRWHVCVKCPKNGIQSHKRKRYPDGVNLMITYYGISNTNHLLAYITDMEKTLPRNRWTKAHLFEAWSFNLETTISTFVSRRKNALCIYKKVCHHSCTNVAIVVMTSDRMSLNFANEKQPRKFFRSVRLKNHWIFYCQGMTVKQNITHSSLDQRHYLLQKASVFLTEIMPWNLSLSFLLYFILPPKILKNLISTLYTCLYLHNEGWRSLLSTH
jgi:hypothetical protein